MLAVCFAIEGLSFPSQYMFSSARQYVNITGNGASFTLPRISVTGTYSEGAFCSRIFLSCTPLKDRTTDICSSGFYRSQNRYTMCDCGSICYYWKGLSTDCLYLIKRQWYTISFMPVLDFSSNRALLEKEGLKIRQNETAYRCTETNKYRSLLTTLWCHFSELVCWYWDS
jgi:hypothetical protein